MRPLKQLDNSTLIALKTALDGYQRFDGSESAPYFNKVINSLIGPIEDLNIWAIRDQINQEDQRRSRAMTIRTQSPDAYERLKTLGEQELRVLRLYGEGHQPNYIADLLNISYRTVVNHKANICTKLGLGSVRDLNKFAHDNLSFL